MKITEELNWNNWSIWYYQCMKKVKRAWDTLSDNERKTIAHSVIAHFSMERNEKIGFIAANEIIDVVLQQAFDPIYNKALSDTLSIVENKHYDLLAEIDSLKRLG